MSCFVPNVVFIVFNDVSTFDLIAYELRSIVILFTALVNGVENVKAFSFVFKLLIVAYVEDAVDDKKYSYNSWSQNSGIS